MGMVSIDELESAIAKELEIYSDEVAEATKSAVDEVSKEAKEEVVRHITFSDRTGKYRKSIAVKTMEETKRGKIKCVHVKKPHYRLAHLLEHGHATRNGGRTRAFPHFKYGEDYVEKELQKRIEEKVKS